MKQNKYALLVIDMQLVAFDGEITPPIASGDQLIVTLSSLISSCRAANIPVIYAQTCAASGQPYAQDVHGWEIHPEVAPLETDPVFYKVGPSVFENSDFNDFLTELETTTIIVCGIWSEGCVSITSRGALKRGYEVWLAANGHGTVRQSESEARELVTDQNTLLAQRGAVVIDSTQISSRIGS